MLKITKIKKDGVAKTLQLNIGDTITAFDGYNAIDELDYLYYDAKSNFKLTYMRESKTFEIEVDKNEDDSLGIDFEIDDSIKTCHNNCIFCFVKQMPQGCRESLYVKDDDYKMSFMCGNFVTLTNCSDFDIDRIIRLKLSPLYVSVHATNPQVRTELLRNKNAGKIFDQLKKLTEGGIQIHAQAVIVPLKNDGEELKRTARDLFSLYPMVKTFAVVPTGITKYREGLTKIDDITENYARKFLQLVETLNAEFGVNFIQPADEYFLRAKTPFKEPEFYGEFEQIENGVGMTTKFLSEYLAKIEPVVLKKSRKALVICGTSIYPIMLDLMSKTEKYTAHLEASVLYVENEFFGKTVTCTGLLTGKDIIKALKKHFIDCPEKYDIIIMPSCVLREGEDVFLDGTTLKEFKKELKGSKIVVNYNGAEGLYNLLAK